MQIFKYRFLLGSSILIFMGVLLKLEHVGGYLPTLIAGILNFVVFLYLFFTDRRKRLG